MRNAPPPSKKRKIKTVHEEKIDFDPAAREEYLTGFHKRKLARRKFAEDENAKKEKEEKLRFRREVCSPSCFFNCEDRRGCCAGKHSTSQHRENARHGVYEKAQHVKYTHS